MDFDFPHQRWWCYRLMNGDRHCVSEQSHAPSHARPGHESVSNVLLFVLFASQRMVSPKTTISSQAVDCQNTGLAGLSCASILDQVYAELAIRKGTRAEFRFLVQYLHWEFARNLMTRHVEILQEMHDLNCCAFVADFRFEKYGAPNQVKSHGTEFAPPVVAWLCLNRPLSTRWTLRTFLDEFCLFGSSENDLHDSSEANEETTSRLLRRATPHITWNYPHDLVIFISEGTSRASVDFAS